ncbi:TonB-dependent receptor domain-containing protein [Sphingobium cupriresistens]|uniref:TonB-dependent receptor domain-containing protein n=1 Tax=Sphingobium cupriresistens TaxID=1132417 RepID=UPI003BF58267
MKTFSKRALLRASAAPAILGASLIATAAFAQDAPQAAEAEAGDTIVVTGSRIARPDLTGTSPVSVVTSQEIQLQANSANIENVLNDFPQITPTQSSTSNNPGGGVATVNLRNLGSQRTLVLVDGRRYMSYDVSQVVDLNTIPSALIERVDVVTGGQSAVYGSDAIGGVVNFILKRDFQGVELNSSYNVTEEGDGQIWDISGTIGSNFDDGRGNVTLFGQYTKRKPTYAGARGFSRNALSDRQDGSAPFIGGGSGSVPQGRVIIPGLGAATGLGCDSQDFSADGSSTCYNSVADSYNFAPVNYLQVPQERFLISAMAQYEINEHFTPYREAQFVNNRVNAELAATPISQGTPFGEGTIGALTIPVNSAFLAPSLRAALTTLDTDGDGYVQAPSWAFRTTQIGPRGNADERNAFRVVAGMKGDIGAGFSYDGYYSYARTKNSQRQSGNVAIDRFLASVSGCRGGETGCAPGNIFGLNNLSQEAIDYMSIGATNLETYTTEVASFAITNGELFDLGAGGVGIAFGAEWRREAGEVEPDEYLSSGNVAGFNPGSPTAGSYTVREFFGEVRVPLLRESFVHKLELNGAARASKYSNAPGNVFTWSAGAELAPVPDLTFRAQYQKAIRGPSVSELFLGNTVSFEGNAEGCDTAAAAAAGALRELCLSQGVPAAVLDDPAARAALGDPNLVNPLTFTGGNPNLREESAKTYTIGAVFSPSFLPGFSATVDYYNIKIDGYIAPVPTDTIGSLCFDSLNLDYCSLIKRNSLGQIDSFEAFNLNSGGLKTAGIDVTANYGLPLGKFMGSEDAKLTFSFNGSRLLKSDYTPVIGVDKVIDCEGRFGTQCGVPTPKWRHTLRTGLELSKVSMSVQWRYIGKSRDDDDDTLYGSEKIKGFSYFDMTFNADVTDNFTLGAGVSNMFNKNPPLSASGQNGGNGEQTNTYPTLYEVLGRSFFLSGKLRF